MEKYTAIITEPRIHPAWKLVLNNFLTNLDERWNFIILCGLSNHEYLIDLVENNFREHKERITIYQINVVNFIVHEYSNFMLNKQIYNLIPTETFLTFQLDTLISAKYKDYIYDFMEYDYVGAPWKKQHIPNLYVGNGGLSLRKKSAILHALDNDTYNIKYLENEDIYIFHFTLKTNPLLKKLNYLAQKQFFLKNHLVHIVVISIYQKRN